MRKFKVKLFEVTKGYRTVEAETPTEAVNLIKAMYGFKPKDPILAVWKNC